MEQKRLFIAAEPEPGRRLRALGHHSNHVSYHLQESSSNTETIGRIAMRHRERPRPEQSKEGRMPRQYTDLAVECRSHDTGRLPVEQRPLGGNKRHTHQADASCFACSTTSSMAPTR